MYATAKTYLNLNIKTIPSENYFPKIEKYTEDEVPRQSENNTPSSVDPKIWGPIFWKQLHISAAHYPLKASPIVKERMKNRILSIPIELPCIKCSIHATQFIESHKDHLDTIVSGRHELGKFYTDFHNHVNKRYGKPEWSYEDVYKKYSGTKVNYE